MRELFLYPITGLYEECHHVEYSLLRDAAPPLLDGPHSLANLNNLWWRHATIPEEIERIADELGRLGSRLEPPFSTVFKFIVADHRVFALAVEDSLAQFGEFDRGPRHAFKCLETLQVFCDAYSHVAGRPGFLTLQEGLAHNDISSLDLDQNALSRGRNPYLGFLEQFAWPVIDSARADLVWMVGPPKISTFAMAKRAKHANPNSHVSVTFHSSEYYSLNKVAKFLKSNEMLFRTVDSVILDDFENTMPQLRDALSCGDDLSSVPNLMFRTSDGAIHQTEYLVAPQSLAFHERSSPVPSGQVQTVHETAEVRLWPNSKCYWNNCNFCAINKRYQTLPRNDFSEVEERVEAFRRLESIGKKYIWSVDEAIPPKDLGSLAEGIIRAGVIVKWETRSKVDRNFDSKICSSLGRSGLVEIRLGLESANARVLALMGKHPEGWSLAMLRRVVSDFFDAGVSVHFPTIVGFPGETSSEREDTYEFLRQICRDFPGTTFNINILGLDVASKLFENYPDFGITTIKWPISSKYFMGNLLDWDSMETPFEYARLDAERNSVMREVLYPWMPESAAIPPYMFYRLTETSRATMVWKSKAGSWAPAASSSNECVVVGPYRLSRYDDVDRWTVYNWETHVMAEVTGPTAAVVLSLQGGQSFDLQEQPEWVQAEYEALVEALVISRDSTSRIGQAIPPTDGYDIREDSQRQQTQVQISRRL
jgi:Radical SAM superfamily